MKTVVIVQARMGSTRLPGKVLKEIGGTPAIDLLLDRLSKGTRFDQVVIATSDQPTDDALAVHLEARGETVVRGSESDVLSRYAKAAEAVEADVIVRITGDCPLIDPVMVDRVIDEFERDGAEYASNVEPAHFPDGLDTEVFTRALLDRAAAEATDAFDREHVTPFIRRNAQVTAHVVAQGDEVAPFRFSLDEEADLRFLRSVFAVFAPRTDMTWQEVVNAVRTNPAIDLSNQSIPVNEGAMLGTGQKLWKRAKTRIPGGNMLLSKRAEMFLPDRWPAYFSKSKGCRVWDMDGNELIDMCFMGIGTNTLGYGHPEVDEAVMRVVRDGNMATLNAPEEVYLAERLVDLHPWASMCRFTRSGGEANAVAIRIARAASGKDGVAICGYHGWHDWYLSVNLAKGDGLAGHLLPGLDPRGVPQDLAGSTHPFQYNDFAAVEALVAKERIGVIKMEVMRNEGPADDFLEKIRKLATDNGIVLIFDECTSGFRETFGGVYKKFGVEPDLMVLGKTLGNGYAVNAVVGREEVMQAAQSTFISSTFWTERIGSAAALATLDVMERETSWDRITALGTQVTRRWHDLAADTGVTIRSTGLPAITTFGFVHDDALALKTLMTQEMLKQGYLATPAFYAALPHEEDGLIDAYFDTLRPVFTLIGACMAGDRNVHDLLDGPVAHGGFRRLN